MSTLLRIANWSEHFENNRTRDMKQMAWVPIPNKLDGDGYTELIDHKNGPTHYAAWVAMVLIASRCGERGTLLRSTNQPHDSRSIARLSRMPVAIFDEAIPRLKMIGWITSEPFDPQGLADERQEPAEIPHPPAPRAHAQNGTERTEGNGRERIHVHFPDWWKAYPRKEGKGVAEKSHEAALKKISLSQSITIDEAAEWLLEITKMFAASSKGKSGQYCPHPSTWLNQVRYDDDPQAWNLKEHTNGRSTHRNGAGQIHDPAGSDPEAGRI